MSHLAAGTGGTSCSGDGSDLRRKSVDLVGAEARPVVVARDDDGCLQVAEAANQLERLGGLADVHDRVLDALLVEGAVGRVALNASRLAVDRDAHLVSLLV